MPEMLTAAPTPVLPQIPVQSHGVWSALRTQLLRDEDPESVVRIRGMLSYLYPTREERVRALNCMLDATPTAFRLLAIESGWDPELEACGIGFDLVVFAAIFGEVNR